MIIIIVSFEVIIIIIIIVPMYIHVALGCRHCRASSR